MVIKLDKDPLVVEQNHYLNKIINVYNVYDLDAWQKNPTNNFKFKNCLFGETNIVKKSDKEKYVYSGYGIAFGSADFRNFDNDSARNIIIFGVDNSSPSHGYSSKNNFSVLSDNLIFGINRSFVSAEKSLALILVKQAQNFVWVCIIMLIIVICLLMEKKV